MRRRFAPRAPLLMITNDCRTMVIAMSERFRSSDDQVAQTGSSQSRPVFLRAADLAQRYRIHIVTVYRWVSRKNLPPPTRLSRGVTAWRSDVLERWEAERSAAKKTV